MLSVEQKKFLDYAGIMRKDTVVTAFLFRMIFFVDYKGVYDAFLEWELSDDEKFPEDFYIKKWRNLAKNYNLEF